MYVYIMSYFLIYMYICIYSRIYMHVKCLSVLYLKRRMRKKTVGGDGLQGVGNCKHAVR